MGQWRGLSMGFVVLCIAPACGDEASAPAKVVAAAREADMARVAAASESPERVRFEPVAPTRTVTVGVLPASVVVPAEHKMLLGPPLEGRVVAWRVGVGDAISPGTVLMDLEVVGVADLEASLAEAQQLLTARTRTLQAERQAATQGMANASGVLAYEVAVAEARARRDALTSQIEARKKAVGGEGWTWTAAVSGVVEKIECPRGQLAQPEAGCLTVVDTSRAVVRVEVPERWLSRWADRPITGELTLTGEAGVVALTEKRRAPRLDDTSRTLTVDFAVSLAHSGPLRRGPAVGRAAVGEFTADAALVPGRSGRVALSAALTQDALAVPMAALTRLDGKDVVFVKTADGATPVEVERLGRDGDFAVVRASGEGTIGEVATRGLFLLKSKHLLTSEDAQ